MIAGLLTRVWIWVGGAVVALTMLVGAFLAVRKGGADAARNAAAVDVGRRTREATQARVEAAKPITATEEANDSFNRDRR